MALPIGIQLYGVRDFMDEDPEKALREIAAMGYDGIEPCGGSYGMEPQAFRALCDELGLKIISAHVSYHMLTTDLDNQLSLYQTLGVEYIAYPYMVEGQSRSFWVSVSSSTRLSTWAGCLSGVISTPA